jgi:hypothetical protein
MSDAREVRVVGTVDSWGAARRGPDQWEAIITLKPWSLVGSVILEVHELLVKRTVSQDEWATLKKGAIARGVAVELRTGEPRQQRDGALVADLVSLEVSKVDGFRDEGMGRKRRLPAVGQMPELAWSGASWRATVDFPSFSAFRDASGPYGQLRGTGTSATGSALVSFRAESESCTPSQAQASAYASFVAAQAHAVAAVCDALVREAPRLAPCFPVFPTLRSPSDVQKHIGLHCVHIRPDAAVGLEFGCTWDAAHGLGMVWKDGRVAKVGSADLAFEIGDDVAPARKPKSKAKAPKKAEASRNTKAAKKAKAPRNTKAPKKAKTPRERRR